jgi:hypothetical protein
MEKHFIFNGIYPTIYIYSHYVVSWGVYCLSFITIKVVIILLVILFLLICGELGIPTLY